MKTKLILLFAILSNSIFAQSINDYAAVIVPTKFSFLSEENQYRLSTITKYNLEEAGFVGIYSNVNFADQYPNRCSVLNLDVVKDSGFLSTKLYIEFKDCFGKVIYTSEVGKSKEKDFGEAYKEALNNAFESVKKLGYKYNGNAGSGNVVAATPAVVKEQVMPVKQVVAAPVSTVAATVNEATLYAQPTDTGYQLIDKTPKVVMKLMKTGNPNSFIAIKGDVQGILTLRDNQWFFDSYQNGALVSEVIAVKF
ncbi:hypothetical protein FFWV33_07405 [Flavobacterium faecale]|uniref:Uncharacterized protein n=1 Tax=Flavobacterium faecale TaxID=1355330 RepID=A0A2S1LCA3_9FLAO|nr:hypothetical protein [Flavobacterium faecale]AWG21364.1 hypothetical protein FFWV33_07405 [Flavobacterium faecale]